MANWCGILWQIGVESYGKLVLNLIAKWCGILWQIGVESYGTLAWNLMVN
jgi:hypothetical protein